MLISYKTSLLYLNILTVYSYFTGFVFFMKVFARVQESTPDINARTLPLDVQHVTLNNLHYLKKGAQKHKDCGGLIGKEDSGFTSQSIPGRELPNEKSVLKGQYIGSIDKVHASEEYYDSLDIHAILVIAKYLKKQTGLTILGFDTVVESCSGNHYIVDVNYFPSCNGVEGVESAIKSAIVNKILTHKNRKPLIP